MKLGFGLITCQHVPGDPRSDADLYEQAIELSVFAEELGFDSVWLTEHHFVDDGYMPSVLATAAAIAARTDRVEIGTGLLLAPLHDPVRLAEDAATVDVISRGRLILGIGMGWRQEEFDGLGVPIAERRTRLLDAVAVMRQAWGDGLVTGTSRRSYPGMSVRPKPYRPGGPPIWIGGFAEPAVRRAGRIADGFMGGDSSVETFAEQVGWAHGGLAERRRQPERFDFSLYQPTFAWEDGDAWPLVRDHHHYLNWKYDDMAEAAGRSGDAPSPPPIAPDEEADLRRDALVGTPAEVTDGIRRYAAAAGDDFHFVAQLYWPGMPYERQREAMRIFAERVAPRIRGG